MKKGSNNKYNTLNDDKIITALKGSLMSDKFIEIVIELYNSNRPQFLGMIKAVNEEMKKFIDSGLSVTEAFEYLKQNRIIRTGNENFDRSIFSIIIECFTPYREEIILHEFKKKMKVVDVNGTKVIHF